MYFCFVGGGLLVKGTDVTLTKPSQTQPFGRAAETVRVARLSCLPNLGSLTLTNLTSAYTVGTDGVG